MLWHRHVTAIASHNSVASASSIEIYPRHSSAKHLLLAGVFDLTSSSLYDASASRSAASFSLLDQG